MKIAYLIRHDITRNDGVTKKILGQIDHWKNLGHEVQVYAYLPRIGDSILPAKQYVMGGVIKSRIFLDKKLLMDIDSFCPNMIYFRYDTWSRSLSKLLTSYPSIVELNTLDLSEFFELIKLEKNIKSILRYCAYRMLRSLVLRKVVGIVSVTNEINRDKSNAQYNKPSIAIPNGIDLSTYNSIKQNARDNSRIGLFFIGTPGQPWHGVDYIEQLASKMKALDFHIVGIDGINHENVYYHGYLDADKYKKILKKCDICIGSLGLHRINMKEACPLKVREYLAYGYPIILGYH
ncbi:hypothetical protein LIR74_005010, partial [Escherichia coli]|nr:hypothetical protein [Escherichia coli]